jgi:hypothetical protein
LIAYFTGYFHVLLDHAEYFVVIIFAS